MPSATTAKRNYIRDMVQIGQVWQHDGADFSIQIKQIHRADRLVEAWLDGPDGRKSNGITFADLRRQYELVETPPHSSPPLQAVSASDLSATVVA
jgi:hypothetical protein